MDKYVMELIVFSDLYDYCTAAEEIDTTPCLPEKVSEPLLVTIPLFDITRYLNITAPVPKRNPYGKQECEHCGKVLPTIYKYNQHVQALHSGTPNPYKCKICGKEFDTTDSHSAHVKTHNKVKDMICNICKKGFCSRKRLLDHIDACHKKGGRCIKCRIVLLSSAELKKHSLECKL